jgi:chromosome segregation ATPase
MIRAFAPGMIMQEPLPQAASSFDVRNEPTAPESEPPFAEPNEAGGELARLEELLLQRTRERRELAQELERRSELLRDACTRLTELAPKVAAAATEHAVKSVREERDAAVARAVEAEVARAEATFRVDELMGQLLGSGRSIPDSALSPTPKERALHSRVAALDEQKQMAEARLVLLEDELAQERFHLANAARDRVETAARLEFEVAQARVWSENAQQKLVELADVRGALLGERDGLRARLDEAERALMASQDRSSRGSRQTAELKDKLDAERTERATVLMLAEARALQIDELTLLRAQDQEQLRELRAEYERALRDATSIASAGDDANMAALRDELERARTHGAQSADALSIRENVLAELQAELERERTQRAETTTAFAARENTLAELMTELERARSLSADSTNTLAASEAAMNELRAELERERTEAGELANVLAVREAALSDVEAELERERSQKSAGAIGLAEVEATLAEVQADVDRKQLQIAASAKAIAARESAFDELQAELERERSARSWLAAQLAAAEAGSTPIADPESTYRRSDASQQEQVETLRACLLELRLPLLEFESEFARIAQGKDRSPNDSLAMTPPRILIDPETLNAMDEQLKQKDTKIEELEAALAAERQARVAASPAEREARATARDTSVATLKGELIDVRANATRLSDDLTRERARRRKIAVTARALQAATESGEAPGPWIEELLSLINEGLSSLPPKA